VNPSFHRKSFWIRSAIAAASALAVALSITTACSSHHRRGPLVPPHFAPDHSPGLTRIISGKPRDLDPALARSASAAGLALLQRTNLPPQTPGLLFTLVGRIGEPATLRIDFPDTGPTDLLWFRTPKDMRLTLRIGRFGDLARERAFADQFERELSALAPEP